MIKYLAVATAILTSSWQVPAPAGPPKPVTVVFETEKGTIEIAVDVARAPVTAENFLRYVDGGFYDGGQFTRTVRPDTETNKENPIQVIQARRAAGRQGFPAIALERTSVTGVKHVDGTVSMARSTAPDSAASDFFICVGDQPGLDMGGKRNPDGQGFGAFGKVVKGMDVVKAIQQSPVSRNAQGQNTQTLTPPIKILRAARRQ